MRDVEYLIRTLFQWEASLKLGVHELFLEGYCGTVTLNWERRNKKASAREIHQHTLQTPLKLRRERERKKKNRDLVQLYFHILNHCTYRKRRTANMRGCALQTCFSKLNCHYNLAYMGKQYVSAAEKVFFRDLLIFQHSGRKVHGGLEEFETKHSDDVSWMSKTWNLPESGFPRLLFFFVIYPEYLNKTSVNLT